MVAIRTLLIVTGHVLGLVLNVGMSPVRYAYLKCSSLLKVYVFFVYMAVCLHARLFNKHVPSVHRVQKKVSDPLEWEFQTVVNCYVCAEN